MTPFNIQIEQSVLDDLNARLAATRWPNEPVSKPWQYGTDLGWMRKVADHWQHVYDWRAWEARLNALPNFMTTIEGQDIHFVYEKGSGDAPMPLLLSHGWPGSIVEFLDVIEPLAHPERFGGNVEDAFTVIVPSLPGYGFSPAPKGPISASDIAALWSKLMTETLGFSHYVAQGGDWGGIVTAYLALNHPQNLSAIHLNIAALQPQIDADHPLSAEEETWRKADAARRFDLTGYRWIQGTRPQTLAYGLTDSPVGLAAWILEKFHDWTVRGQDGPPPFDLDHLLTNVMLYWLNGINGANWMYVSLMDNSGRGVAAGQGVQVPTGFMLCPDDLGELPPNSWLERAFNVTHRVNAPSGGHFLALEQKDVFVAEVRSFFADYRGRSGAA